jgi:hypothetical protein
MEEDGVPRLVDLLRGEEVLLLLLRRRVDVGGEVVGHRVLAEEEHRVDPERRLALEVGERVPALAVAGEVELVGAPVALLPALVEVLVGDRGPGPDPVLLRNAHPVLLSLGPGPSVTDRAVS